MRRLDLLPMPEGAIPYIDKIGLRPFTEGERARMSVVFASELRRGLENPQNPGSLQMIDTHLTAVTAEDLKRHIGEEAHVLEIGGTNVRAALTRINAQGEPKIVYEASGLERTVQGELSKRRFKNPEDFFATILPHVEPILRGARLIRNLAIIYSFPGKAVDTPLGVDIVSPDELPKGFSILGIHEQPFGLAFIQYLSDHGYNMSALKSLVILNDTVATMSHEAIGGVVGTGYNLAIRVGGKIYNTECGNFHDVPQHALAAAIDEMSDRPGSQLAEKQISGMYLGRQMDLAIRELSDLGILHIRKVNPSEPLPGEVLSHILSWDVPELRKFIDGDFTLEAEACLQSVAKRLRARSTQLVALHLSTIVRTFPGEFPDQAVRVPIDGSVFWRMPGYLMGMQAYAGAGTSHYFEFPYIKHPGIVGAGAAAIGRK